VVINPYYVRAVRSSSDRSAERLRAVSGGEEDRAGCPGEIGLHDVDLIGETLEQKHVVVHKDELQISEVVKPGKRQA
jgi:hypothetical protein